MSARRRAALQSLVLKEMTAVVPLSVVERLAADFGGRSLYIPKDKVGASHPLMVAIGLHHGAIVQEYFGGTTINFPLPRDKAEQIRELSKTIEHRGDIASKVGCTERWVYKVLGKPKASTGPDLFT